MSQVQRDKAVTPFKTIGVSGVTIHSGFIQDNERNPELRDIQRFDTYSEIMANTAMVGAAVRRFFHMVSKAKWKFIPAADNSQAQKYADLAQDIMNNMNMPWSALMRKTAIYRFMGFSVLEWTAAKRDDGVIAINKVQHRPQFTLETWDLDDEGAVKGVNQTNPQNFSVKYLPRDKIIYAVDDAITEDPRGTGIFRHIVRAAKRLKAYEDLELSGFESDLRGIPICKIPISELDGLVKNNLMKPEERNAIVETYKEFVKKHIRGSNTGAVIDSEPFRDKGENAAPIDTPKYNVELLTGDHYGHAEVAAAIERLTREIARVLDMEQMLLGSTAVGSMALSEDKSDSFYLVVNGCLEDLSHIYKRDWLDPIWWLNSFPEDMKPNLTYEEIRKRDYKQITEALADLKIPLMPEDESVGEIFDGLGLTRLTEKLADGMDRAELVRQKQEEAIEQMQQTQSAKGGDDPKKDNPKEDDE